jgi:hypothetical protein
MRGVNEEEDLLIHEKIFKKHANEDELEKRKREKRFPPRRKKNPQS